MNRLGAETSPYLRQHADNPVAWYPWGEEAFARARAEDRPVFLSVGYSACHWCHVMAHESFEDDAVAATLNARFVAVKVDREERPDVDAVYMEAVQAATGSGGWPMSVFLTPDGRPFFAGTYYPPTDRYGTPGFGRVLAAVDEAWRARRPEVEHQADALAEAVARRARLPADLLTAPGADRSSARDLLGAATAELGSRFDPRFGGFGPAPKFPQPQLVELCLRRHRLEGDAAARAMATVTLRAMAAGGIYDHLGGGFARYATDATWTVPHFEKMLYDQAGLVRAYLHAGQATGEALFARVVAETVAYVLDTLRLPGGGLASAEDADSEGEEGRFYLWTPAELVEAAGPDLGPVAAAWYGVTEEGNFEGRSILRRPPDDDAERPAPVEEARRRLLEARARRPRPGLDDKVLTEWNAMFCAALAEAAAVTGRRDWGEAAGAIARFLLAELRRPDGRWLRSWQGGRARHLAYAGDYAWVVECCTRLAELTGDPAWLGPAADTARAMLELFGDEGPLLATTGSDAERLVVRPVDVLDGAVPAANSVAAAALLRLGALTGDDELRQAGEGLVDALWGLAQEHPLAAAGTVAAAALARGGTTEVVISGERPDLLAVVRRRFEPTAVVAWGTPGPSPLWAGRAPGLAYVCRGFVCRAPAATPDELEQRLEDERAADGAEPAAVAGGGR
ncbi:MAG TPA: thioredoxin domain-containing protein [Acidimicrobiales bacterium]|nr:thioredoxin domain-containing protein [Acidimicrobiales bacterium]